MIEKPAILITSLGRTGTKFFANIYQELIPDCTALHEPDTLHLVPRRLLKQVRTAGIYRMVFLKAIGRWSMPTLSHSRVKGTLDYQKAVYLVERYRKNFIAGLSGGIYVESSLAYYGLIDVAADVFNNHKLIYIIRDGRNWIRSKMNRGVMYNRGFIQGLLAHRWPTGRDFQLDGGFATWEKLSRFERICWAWTTLNRYALETIKLNPHSKLFYFEDIFESNNSEQNLKKLVDFSTSHINVRILEKSLIGKLQKRVNISSGDFPDWEDWSRVDRSTFSRVCGSLMKELGYF